MLATDNRSLLFEVINGICGFFGEFVLDFCRLACRVWGQVFLKQLGDFFDIFQVQPGLGQFGRNLTDRLERHVSGIVLMSSLQN